jgi:hypothetical protein
MISPTIQKLAAISGLVSVAYGGLPKTWRTVVVIFTALSIFTLDSNSAS